MSSLYDEYLIQHKSNVAKGFNWIRDNIPELLPEGYALEWQITMAHDESKTQADEYDAYDAWFYGGNKSFAVSQAYKTAWLLHLHRNPHHWQYWILINDDPKEGMVVMDIPDNYILEMICDWWAFSWKYGNLDEIFKWYEEHGPYMKLSIRTRQKVEGALSLIKQKLESERNDI